MSLPKMLVKALILDQEGRILLVRRCDTRRGIWELPGGGVDSKEAPHAAIKREIAEETGLNLKVGSPVAKGLLHSRRRIPWRAYGVNFEGDHPVRVNHTEHDRAGWFHRHDLPLKLDQVSAEILRRTEKNVDG